MKWKNKKTGEIIECSPTLLNASKVSAQNRKRLFWVGKLDEFGTYQKVEISQPEDKGILLKDILEESVDEKYYISDKKYLFIQRNGVKINFDKEKANTLSASYWKMGKQELLNTCLGCDFRYDEGIRIKTDNKSNTLTAKGGGISGRALTIKNYNVRMFTPTECERLQGLPDNYTEGVSNTQRYKQLGNAFNVEVVAHIIKELK